MSSKPALVNDYLLELQARERTRQRNRLMVGIALASVTGMALLVPMMVSSRAEEGMPVFSYEELNPDRVKAYFTASPGDLLLMRSASGRVDTLRSYEDYLWMNASNVQTLAAEVSLPEVGEADSSQFAQFAAQPAVLSEAAPGQQAPQEQARRGFSFVVDGELRVDEPVTFRITNFDPALTYELDLGNGVRRRVSRTYRYTYPAAGVFQVALVVSGPDVPRETFATSSLSIAAKNAPAAAEAAPVVTPAQPAEPAPLPVLSPVSAAPAPAAPQPAITSSAAPAVSSPVRPNQPMIAPAVEAAYPGGRDALNAFIARSLRFPSGETREGSMGVRFVVDAAGQVSQPAFINTLGPAYERELIQVLRRMPAWTPARQDGIPVASYQTVRVRFVMAVTP